MEPRHVREHSGRTFSAEEMSLIVETVRMYPKLSRREIASTVCETVGWLTPNGKPKWPQCAEFLRLLEEEGALNLPEIRAGSRREKGCLPASDRCPVLDGADTSEVTECGEIKLKIVRPGEGLTRWRWYVGRYHALGDPHVYGSQMRYMITSESRDLGCLLFSASSWALACRDEWIGWTAKEKKERLHLIVNNARFLLLPYVNVRNLASRALSMAARRLQGDWLEEYCYAPVLLETFVDAPYRGTCYKAANWTYLGETQGRGRNDRRTGAALTKKAIFVYPLQRDYRAVLRGEKPWKAVETHI